MTESCVMTTIRPAVSEDAAAIARVYVDSWRSTYAGLVPDHVLVKMSFRRQVESWSRFMRHKGRWDVVAVAEDTAVIGFGTAGPARGGTTLPYRGEVYTLYLLQDYQGLGIGKALLRTLFASLIERGMDSALVWVLVQNPARYFYRWVGGTQIAERKHRLWGADVSEVAFGWPELKRVVAPGGPCSVP